MPTAGPLAKAVIFLAPPPTEQVRPSDDWDRRTVTDAEGRFELPDPGERWAVVAQTTAGAATAEFPADRADAGTLKVAALGLGPRRFQDGGKPVKACHGVREPSPCQRPHPTASLFRPPNHYRRRGAGSNSRGCRPVRSVVQVSIGPWEDEDFDPVRRFL